MEKNIIKPSVLYTYLAGSADPDLVQNPDPDPRRQKSTRKIKNIWFEEFDVLSGELEASP